jgi:hypothetical protein
MIEKSFNNIIEQYTPTINWIQIFNKLGINIIGETKILIKCSECLEELKQFIENNQNLTINYLQIQLIKIIYEKGYGINLE